MNIKKLLMGLATWLMLSGGFAVVAYADSVGPINFESPYTTGNINGQSGWMKTGPYSVEVANVSAFSNASGFGFGNQALRLDNSVTSGSFGDQTFSPGLTNPSSETSNSHFEASFDIGSTQATQQPGLFLSVSPDDGNGSRMSYVGFDDQADGIHVIFYNATDPGPLGTVANFNSTDLATIDRTSKHTIKFVIDLVPGPANDVVKVYVDGVLKITDTTWEDYYRYDPEQTGNGNVVPSISKLLFKEGGSAVVGTAGNGYLIDNVSLMSGTPAPVLVGPPTTIKECLKGGWKTFNNPTFNSQFQCAWYVLTHKVHKSKVDVDIKMSDPRQKMEAELKEGTGSNLGNVEYQNLDYPGGLKYKAKALCVYVNKSTKESRFMFQIPAGHPGLSGLYVVSYVKDGGVPGKTHDLYGHNATSDLATAQSWCSDGTGFAPNMYSVTNGNVLVH